MLFSWLKVALTLIFVTKTASTDLGQEQSILTQPVYYDCGSLIIYEILIQDMLYASGIDINEIASPFIELLYDLELNYRKIKVPERLNAPKSFHGIRPASNSFVIIDQMRQIVDLVVQMKNGHYIKCERVNESAPESPNIGQKNDYGYECGHDLFSHDIVQMSAGLARSNKVGNKLFLTHYQGPLYWPGLNYKIYPLSREKNQHYAGKISLVPENIYFIVISPTGEMIDVIAQLMSGDFIKCIRTTKVPPVLEADQDLRSGYLCGLEFFEINHMKRTAKLARARKLQQGKLTYPKEYEDSFFKGFMYPLFPNGRFYGTGPGHQSAHSIYHMSSTVRSAMGIITPCEASTREIEALSPETGNFICGYSNTGFSNKRLLELVECACKALGSVNRRYPAMYNGPAFDIRGPYVTWPIRKGIKVTGLPTKFRVVMNNECMLAGVIALDGKDTFYKCRRSNDNSIPGGDSDIPITEKLFLQDRKQIWTKETP
ncbi:hypothetical protein EPUL_004994, partial [Erysiphe pulchra]